MAFHLNIWAPTADFGAAYSAALQPVTRAADNQSYFVDVDFARVVAIGAPISVVTDSSDFNGDLRSDILWRNDDGSVAVWELNGGSIAGGALVGTAGTDWHVMNSGDFNLDGMSDVLWRNDNGSVAIWER
jgi:hypothetical protein